jgi:hypothetical protein
MLNILSSEQLLPAYEKIFSWVGFVRNQNYAKGTAHNNTRGGKNIVSRETIPAKSLWNFYGRKSQPSMEIIFS